MLDIKLSRQDRYEVLAAIRRVFGTPVIMVTVLADDLDKMRLCALMPTTMSLNLSTPGNRCANAAPLKRAR